MLAQEGYHDEQKLLQHYFRRHAYIVHASLVEKPADPEKLWPIDGEKGERNTESMAERLLRKTKEALEKKKALAQE